MLLALNLTLLPPLYFFNFLYYTETVSLTFVLLAFVLAKRNEHKVVSLCGLASVIVRQTNILWIMLIMVEYVLATLQSIFRFTFTSLEVNRLVTRCLCNTLYMLLFILGTPRLSFNCGPASKKFPLHQRRLHFYCQC